MAPDCFRRRLFLLGFVLLLLAPGLEAQRGKRGGKRPPGGAKGAKQDPLAPFFAPVKPDAKGEKKPSAPLTSVPTLSEADLVTGVADLTREREEAERLALHQHFAVCDLDGNGWLSLREAEITLSLGRNEYQRLDADRDGRLLEAELEPHKKQILARLGALHPDEPLLVAPGTTAPGATAEEPLEPDPADAEAEGPETRRMYPAPVHLLARYDLDRTGGLAPAEVTALFSEVSLGLSAEMVVAQMDTDESTELESRELVPLCFLVARHLPGPLRPPEPEPTTPVELAREEPAPLQAVAPALEARTHFARLDPSGDGAVDDTDLRALQSPARLGIRVEAVLSALDGNGDGRLSEDEFRRAMGLD